jgi:hypothetical protein
MARLRELGPAVEEIDLSTPEIRQHLLQHLGIEVVEPQLGSLAIPSNLLRTVRADALKNAPNPPIRAFTSR